MDTPADATVLVAAASGLEGWPQLEQKRLLSRSADPQETQFPI
jgi:hypothetical protein